MSITYVDELNRCFCICHSVDNVHHIIPCCYKCYSCGVFIKNGCMTIHMKQYHSEELEG